MKHFKFTLCLAIWAAAGLALMAQADRGTITGRVTDESGALIPGVDVVATNTEKGIQSAAITNDLGFYRIQNVPVGPYRVTFSLTGFKSFERSGLTVGVAQTVELNATLRVGEVTETITVSADSELVNTSSSEVSTTMQSEVIEDLPLSFAGGRAVENFAYAVTPGVEGNNWTSYLVGGSAFSKEVLIDGISATAQIQGHIGESSPTMEAVQEFKVQTNGLSAEYGRTSGGIFNFALKRGTNGFNGSAFYYARNEALNANSWMNNWQLSQNPDDSRFDRPKDRQHLYGVSAGGPVRIPGLYDGRDRTFFFGAFEHYEQERLQLGQMNRTVPIPAFLNGDFSSLLTDSVVATDALERPVYQGAIYDPDTLRQVNGMWVADPFEGNIIPGDRISGMSRQITEIYRQGYLPMIPGRLTNNSAITQFNTPWFHQTQLTLTGDHAFSDANKLSGSLIWTQRPRILVDSGGIWDPLAENGTGGPLSRARKQEVTSRRATLANNWTISPTLINTVSLAYNRYRNPSLSSASDEGWSETLGLGDDTSAGHFPEISFGSAINGIETTTIGYTSAGYYVGNTYIVGDSLSWIKGRHSFKFGGEFWHQQMNSHSGAGMDPLRFGFSPGTTGIPGQSWSDKVGFGFASFLLGEVDSASRTVPFDLYGRRNYIDLYVHDDFKVTSNLTLNLGLRWEQDQPYHEKYGRWASFNPEIINTDLNLPGALEFATPDTSFERNKDWTNFAPRVGLAYQIKDRIVLRAGYGIYYTPLGIQYWGGVPYSFAPGYRGSDFVSSQGFGSQFNWDVEGYPGFFEEASLDPNFLQWGMVAIDPDALTPGETHQYNVSVQYGLNADNLIEFTFLGNQGRNLNAGHLRRNQPTRANYEDPNINPFAWIWDEDSSASAGVAYPYGGFSGFAGMAITPFPQVSATFGPIFWVGSPLGESSYNSFQVSFNRRMSTGLASNVSYNYSKAKGNAETNFDETWDAQQGIQDVFALDQEAGTVLSFDQSHILKGYVSFELPFGRGRRWMSGSSGILDAILGGWTGTTIFRYASGFPLGINPGASRPGWDGAVYANADFAAIDTVWNEEGFNPGDAGSASNLYFKTAAFSQPEGHQLGNGRRLYDELRGSGNFNEDIGLMKNWYFGEDYKLQFRAEMLNVFNRHHFANPVTNLNSPFFGRIISTTGSPRNVQLGLRLEW